MSYIDRNLIANEQVLIRTRLHWSIFLLPFLLFLISAALFYLDKETFVLGVVFLIMGVGTWFMAFVSFSSSEFAVTNYRVLAKWGMLSRYTRGMMLNKVETINVKQTWFERIFGYGSIILIGAGGTHDVFPNIDKPFKFRDAIQSAIIPQTKKE